MIHSNRPRKRIKISGRSSPDLLAFCSSHGGRNTRSQKRYRSLRRGLTRSRQTDGKRAPFAGPALHVDGPAVAFGDPFREGEPEACALRLARPGGIGSIESLEEMRKRVRRDTHPGIGHGNVGESLRTGERDRDSSAFWRELDRVVEQNQQQALQPSGIALDRHAVRHARTSA